MKRVLIFAVIASGIFSMVIWAAVFLSMPIIEDGTTFTIEKGESVRAIASHLRDQGIIRSEIFFRLAVKNSDFATRIQPGVHALSGVGSYSELIEVLASGIVTAEEDVLLVREGETLRDIRSSLEELNHPAAEGLFAVTGVPAEPGGEGWDTELLETFAFLQGVPHRSSLEGYLFPDTYRIFKDASAKDIVVAMLENTERKLDGELRDKISSSERSLYEIITLASIVEREVRGNDDMRMVADLFWRRYDVGMGLQADSTVNYVTEKGLASVSLEDTRIDSVYNTYRYRGLPYGPIGNPGLYAILAAADPDPNEYWYFLTDNEGIVRYGRNLDEHNANKARYLR